MVSTESIRRPRRSDVRAEILDAATRAFLIHGYRRTNLAELAASAGYSKGAVYSNFGGKPELFGEVMNTRASEFADQALAQFDLLFTAGDPHLDPDQGAEKLAAVLAEAVRADQSWPMLLEEFRNLAAEDTRLRAIFTAWRISQRTRLANQIATRRAAALGLPETIDVQAAAELLILLMNTLQLEMRAAPDAAPPVLVTQTLALALRSIVR